MPPLRSDGCRSTVGDVPYIGALLLKPLDLKERFGGEAPVEPNGLREYMADVLERMPLWDVVKSPIVSVGACMGEQ